MVTPLPDTAGDEATSTSHPELTHSREGYLMASSYDGGSSFRGVASTKGRSAPSRGAADVNVPAPSYETADGLEKTSAAWRRWRRIWSRALLRMYTRQRMTTTQKSRFSTSTTIRIVLYVPRPMVRFGVGFGRLYR